MSDSDLVEIYIRQQDWEEADEHARERLLDKARDDCYRSEIEFMGNDGLVEYFRNWEGDNWMKPAMQILNFDYDAAAEEYVRDRGIGDIIAEYDGDELELPDPRVLSDTVWIKSKCF